MKDGWGLIRGEATSDKNYIQTYTRLVVVILAGLLILLLLLSEGWMGVDQRRGYK